MNIYPQHTKPKLSVFPEGSDQQKYGKLKRICDSALFPRHIREKYEKEAEADFKKYIEREKKP